MVHALFKLFSLLGGEHSQWFIPRFAAAVRRGASINRLTFSGVLA